MRICSAARSRPAAARPPLPSRHARLPSSSPTTPIITFILHAPPPLLAENTAARPGWRSLKPAQSRFADIHRDTVQRRRDEDFAAMLPPSRQNRLTPIHQLTVPTPPYIDPRRPVRVRPARDSSSSTLAARFQFQPESSPRLIECPRMFHARSPVQRIINYS